MGRENELNIPGENPSIEIVLADIEAATKKAEIDPTKEQLDNSAAQVRSINLELEEGESQFSNAVRVLNELVSFLPIINFEQIKLQFALSGKFTEENFPAAYSNLINSLRQVQKTWPQAEALIDEAFTKVRALKDSTSFMNNNPNYPTP